MIKICFAQLCLCPATVCWSSLWRVWPGTSRFWCLGNSEARVSRPWSLWTVWGCTLETLVMTTLALMCAMGCSDMVCWASKRRSCCSGSQGVRLALGSLYLLTWAPCNLKMKFCSPLLSQNRREESQSYLPFTSQCLQHNRVWAAASGGWMLSCKDIL